MTTSWKIQIDWDRDGDFTAALDDITDYVMSAKWVLGLQKPYQDVAQEMTLGLILRNSDRRFSPENTASPLAGKVRPQVPARVVSDDGVTERVMVRSWRWLGGAKPAMSRCIS